MRIISCFTDSTLYLSFPLSNFFFHLEMIRFDRLLITLKKKLHASFVFSLLLSSPSLSLSHTQRQKQILFTKEKKFLVCVCVCELNCVQIGPGLSLSLSLGINELGWKSTVHAFSLLLSLFLIIFFMFCGGGGGSVVSFPLFFRFFSLQLLCINEPVYETDGGTHTDTPLAGAVFTLMMPFHSIFLSLLVRGLRVRVMVSTAGRACTAPSSLSPRPPSPFHLSLFCCFSFECFCFPIFLLKWSFFPSLSCKRFMCWSVRMCVCVCVCCRCLRMCAMYALPFRFLFLCVFVVIENKH